MRGLIVLPAVALILACQSEAEREQGGAFSSVEGNAVRSDNAAAAPAPPAPTPTPTPATTPAPAQRGAVSPDAPANLNTAQRAAILDALRPAIERQLGGAVEFVVSQLAVEDGWALVTAEPQRPGGGVIDGQRYFPDSWQDMDGLTVSAIMRFRGGRWNLADHAIGPTDMWHCGYEGPPRSLTGC